MDDFGLILVVVVAALIIVCLASHRLWYTPETLGRIGESKIAGQLWSLAKKNNEYKLFNGVILETVDGTTQVDHIVVSPFGIFVIETKNMKGWIFGDERQKRWTQSLMAGRYMGFSWSKKYQFMNPLHQNYKHVMAVQTLLGISSRFIFNVVVFAGDSQFMTEMPANVLGKNDLIPYIKFHRDRILEDDKVERFSQVLSNHIENMEHLHTDNAYHLRNLARNREDPICPRCGNQMVVRTTKRVVAASFNFWGCSRYPLCKATRRIEV